MAETLTCVEHVDVVHAVSVIVATKQHQLVTNHVNGVTLACLGCIGITTVIELKPRHCFGVYATCKSR